MRHQQAWFMHIDIWYATYAHIHMYVHILPTIERSRESFIVTKFWFCQLPHSVRCFGFCSRCCTHAHTRTVTKSKEGTPNKESNKNCKNKNHFCNNFHSHVFLLTTLSSLSGLTFSSVSPSLFWYLKNTRIMLLLFCCGRYTNLCAQLFS